MLLREIFMIAYIRRVFFFSFVAALAACSARRTVQRCLPPASTTLRKPEPTTKSFKALGYARCRVPRYVDELRLQRSGTGWRAVHRLRERRVEQGHIGLTGPSSYVRTGATWQYALSFTDLSYKGKCTLAWEIKAGKKTVDSFSASFKLTSDGGFVLYAVDRARPKYSGPATLTGKYTCGKNSQSAQAPLYFQ